MSQGKSTELARVERGLGEALDKVDKLTEAGIGRAQQDRVIRELFEVLRGALNAERVVFLNAPKRTTALGQPDKRQRKAIERRSPDWAVRLDAAERLARILGLEGRSAGGPRSTTQFGVQVVVPGDRGDHVDAPQVRVTEG